MQVIPLILTLGFLGPISKFVAIAGLVAITLTVLNRLATHSTKHERHNN